MRTSLQWSYRLCETQAVQGLRWPQTMASLLGFCLLSANCDCTRALSWWRDASVHCGLGKNGRVCQHKAKAEEPNSWYTCPEVQLPLKMFYDNIGLFSLNISSFIFLQKRKIVVLTMHKEANLVANEYMIMYEAIFVQLSHLQPEISDSSGSNKLSCSVS